MSTSNERERLFEAMEQELHRYQKARERGERPPAPDWDPELFLELRRWQTERMRRQAEEMGIKLAELQPLPDSPPSRGHTTD